MASRFRVGLPGLSWAFQKEEDEHDGRDHNPAGLSEKGTATGEAARHDGSSDSSSERVTEEAQDGVKHVEGMALVWSTRDLYVAYAFIFLIFFANSYQQQTTGNLTAYVTSDFFLHSLVGSIGTASSIISGVLKLPVAKMLDLWGRAEGYIFMMALTTIGLILMAACDGVKVYAAAQVFYWVGFSGISYTLQVFMADTSSLKNRAYVFAFSTAPYIATTFAGPATAQAFYEHSTWRWGHGVWAIVLPIVSLPFVWIVFRNQKAGKRSGVIPPRAISGRSFLQAVAYYFWEFDVIGIILLCAGVTLVLLPLSLAGYQKEKWRAASMIVMFVVGGVCLAVFVIYERFFAKVTFIPYRVMTDRTILGACLTVATVFVSFYCWDGYYYSYVQVVHNQSIKNTGYIYNIYSIGSCFWAFAVAAAIRVTKRFKWLAVYFGVPVYILGTGLMIHFRQPHVNIGYVIMCQIFIAFAGGTLVICEELAIMSASPHKDVAAALAFLSMFSNIGGGIGSSIAGAIWTNTLPAQLEKYFPKEEAALIYSSIVVQLGYEWGTPEREAINAAFGHTQKLMSITGTVIMVLAFGFVLMWRDIKISDVKNTRGRVI